MLPQRRLTASKYASGSVGATFEIVPVSCLLAIAKYDIMATLAMCILNLADV